ncbi:MAG: GNAT family N-acetyltransferase [Oscillospiraceae bacterium]|nr:GNAT family N-acetyltransferase [Oscillospiraceae bacterium]
MFLETPRLILRKFEESDFADYCEYAIDSDMARMMGRYDFQNEEEARLNFNWLKDKEPRGYVIVLKATGKVIGNFTVYGRGYSAEQYPQLAGKVGKDMSFCIGRRYQRQGLIYEACRHVVEHLFKEEQVDYIAYDHFDFNTPSRNLCHKLGFAPIGSERFSVNDEEVTGIQNILWNPDK